MGKLSRTAIPPAASDHRTYAYWGTKTATSPPSAEWFRTDRLGTGVRSQWAGVSASGAYDQVNYIFRD
jgi:hypothetical protein